MDSLFVSLNRLMIRSWRRERFFTCSKIRRFFLAMKAINF